MAAVAFAGLLVVIMRSEEVRGILTDLVRRAPHRVVMRGWVTRAAERCRVRCRLGDRGSAAAELALAVPAVVLVIALGVGALGAASRQVALQDASADAARLLGRGEDAGAATAVVQRAVPGASVSTGVSGDLVCVTASIDLAVGRMLRMPLQASSCALDGGR